MSNEELIQNIGTIISENSQITSNKKLGEAIVNSSDFRYVSCSSEIANELMYKFEYKHIPYIFKNEKNGFLIKTEDVDKVKNIIKEANLSLEKYIQEYDLQDEVNDILKTGYGDCELLTVNELNYYECSYLKRKCKKIAPDFRIAQDLIDIEGDKEFYSITVPAKYLVSSSPKKNDFFKAYLKMSLELYSPSIQSLKEISNNEKDFDKDFESNIENGKTFYIVNEISSKKNDYIKVTPTGYKTSNHKNKTVHEDEYKSSLYNLVEEMPLKSIKSEEEFIIWKNEKTSIKQTYTDFFKNTLKHEKLTDAINYAIKEKIKVQNIQISNSGAKFEFCKNEAKEIIESITKNNIESFGKENGYSEKAVAKIKKAISGIDLKDISLSSEIIANHSTEFTDLTQDRQQFIELERQIEKNKENNK